MVLNRGSSYCMLDKVQRENIINLLISSRSNKETVSLQERLVKKANYLTREDIKLIYNLKRDYRKVVFVNAKTTYKNHEINILLIVCALILILSQYLDNYI